MKTSSPTIPMHHETTYQMLVESEQKERGVIEIVVYFLLIAATAVTIWQFGTQPVTFADLDNAHAQRIAAFYS
jgi:hypothetical protein